MSDQTAAAESALAVFRRRLVALAAAPRAKLWPAAVPTLQEVIALLDELAAQQAEILAAVDLTPISSRLERLERSMAILVQINGRPCDDD